MTPMRHSQLARLLIKECGGLEDAAKACRLSKSQLSNAQLPHHDAVLAIDVVADLEAYCGKPIYSSALVDHCAEVDIECDFVGEAIELNAKTALLLSHIHEAKADGVITPAEASTIMTICETVRVGCQNINTDLESCTAQRKSSKKKTGKKS